MNLVFADEPWPPPALARVTTRAERVLRVAAALARAEGVDLGSGHLARALLGETEGPHVQILGRRAGPTHRRRDMTDETPTPADEQPEDEAPAAEEGESPPEPAE